MVFLVAGLVVAVLSSLTTLILRNPQTPPTAPTHIEELKPRLAQSITMQTAAHVCTNETQRFFPEDRITRAQFDGHSSNYNRQQQQYSVYLTYTLQDIQNVSRQVDIHCDVAAVTGDLTRFMLEDQENTAFFYLVSHSFKSMLSGGI